MILGDYFLLFSRNLGAINHRDIFEFCAIWQHLLDWLEINFVYVNLVVIQINLKIRLVPLLLLFLLDQRLGELLKEVIILVKIIEESRSIARCDVRIAFFIHGHVFLLIFALGQRLSYLSFSCLFFL